MGCETISTMLPELLEGRLEKATEQDVLSHLARCACCRQELAFWAGVSDTLKAEQTDMPQELFEEISGNLGINRKLTVRESIEIIRNTLGITGSVMRMALSMTGTGNK